MDVLAVQCVRLQRVQEYQHPVGGDRVSLVFSGCAEFSCRDGESHDLGGVGEIVGGTGVRWTCCPGSGPCPSNNHERVLDGDICAVCGCCANEIGLSGVPSILLLELIFCSSPVWGVWFMVIPSIF